MTYRFYLFMLLFIIFSSKFQAQDESWKVYDDSQVAVIRIAMDNSDLQFMLNNVDSDSLHPCTIVFKNAEINDTVGNVGIRIRGNTSRNVAKKSLKLSFNTFSKEKKNRI